MKKIIDSIVYYRILCAIALIISYINLLHAQTAPDKIHFIRQGVQRLIFDENQRILISKLDPNKTVGLSVMHPTVGYTEEQPQIYMHKGDLIFQAVGESETSMWLGGMNPFATYTIDIAALSGKGKIGFEFSDAAKKEQLFVTVSFEGELLDDVRMIVKKDEQLITDRSIATQDDEKPPLQGKLILQMLGSGLVLYFGDEGLPMVIGQADFSEWIDLRAKHRMATYQSDIYVCLKNAEVKISKAEVALTPGVGQADIRLITYENAEPLLDQGRLWYTMSVRGRALPHHIQGVFSMNPSVFDIKFEGLILYDRGDDLLRNEIASHIFYDRNSQTWRGITTGFSAFANPQTEKKQLLIAESNKDPRFGFSVMGTKAMGIEGDVEDPQLIYDAVDKKWRMLVCRAIGEYKAVMLESEEWDKNYKLSAGPVNHNSTGTSIQKIGDKLYCFSGSSEREIFIYTYPDLKEAGTLKVALPPWDNEANTRVWPNVVQLPDGYPFQYIALMMDRMNYPGMKGPNWSYGAMYLYYGY